MARGQTLAQRERFKILLKRTEQTHFNKEGTFQKCLQQKRSNDILHIISIFWKSIQQMVLDQMFYRQNKFREMVHCQMVCS